MKPAIAYFGTYDPAYPRNAVLLAGLRELGVEVHEFRAELPSLAAVEMATPRGAARLALGVAAAHLQLLSRHRRTLEVDAVVVGYPGHFLVPFGWLLSRWRRVRLVFDPLVSLWDTFAGDRGLVATSGWRSSAVRGLDRLAFALPDLLLADTHAHARYYVTRFGLSPRQLAVVPVGAAPSPEATGAAREPAKGEPLRVFQYGKWSPLHGAGTVLDAAEQLRGAPFRFLLAGEGQLSAELRAGIARRGLDNVEWLGALSPAELRRCTLDADICLGIFGDSDKAARVVPNKVYDALACGRPVVTADTSGARELLHDGVNALLVRSSDGAALARALRGLEDGDTREGLGTAALDLYRRSFTPAAVAAEMLAALARP